MTEPRPGPGHTLIRVEAVGLNRADVLYMQMAERPWRIGIDCAGTVIETDPASDALPVGARVLTHLPGGGAAAEILAVDTPKLVRLPDSVSSVVGAALPLAGLVARRLVRTAGDLRGLRVLITGASGGVGFRWCSWRAKKARKKWLPSCAPASHASICAPPARISA
ncbi:alcohol dehydrogenase catalytic domain-containing protein [Nocardia aurantiaca]|uniref:alcohol dehydrogenase catalytic domain-containing protein n=1 Tax=Nocardia aurantiaca TaxID=2675850 RepID=UPI0018A95B0F|nr:alcohol dehydrogenase catalytic domain-containing protein [Nocardia aurantiaca]